MDEEGDMDQAGREFERCVDGVLEKETHFTVILYIIQWNNLFVIAHIH